MDVQFKNRTTTIILDVLELKEEHDNGYDIVGFAYNADKHCYDYIFKKTTGQNINYTDTTIHTKDFSPAQTSTRFMFKNALINIGVKPQTAADWIKVRQAKKAAQTETAFRMIEKQIKLAMDAYGVDADDIIRVAIDRNWQSVKCEWLDNVDWSYYGIQVGKNDLPFGEQKWE